MNSEHARRLRTRLERREAVVAIVGLGYVGLSLAAALGRAGFRIEGIDVSLEKVSSLRNGMSYVGDVADAVVAELTSARQLHASTEFDGVKDADVAKAG